jgi:hypothetical protein
MAVQFRDQILIMDLTALQSLTPGQSMCEFEECVKKKVIYEGQLKGGDMDEEDEKECKDNWHLSKIVLSNCYLSNGHQILYFSMLLSTLNLQTNTCFTMCKAFGINLRSEYEATSGEICNILK